MTLIAIILRSSFSEYKFLFVLLFLVFGIFQCFYGYRFFKAIMALFGFLIGAALGFLIGGLIGKNEIPAFVGALIGGGIMAELVVLFYYVSVFLMGASVGGISMVLLNLLFQMPPNITVIIIAAILGGIIALYFQKLVIILGTSFNGAYLIISSLFLLFMHPEKFSFLFYLNDQAISFYNLETTVFLYSILILLLGIIGVFFQYGKLQNFQEDLANGNLKNSLKITKEDIHAEPIELQEQFKR